MGVQREVETGLLPGKIIKQSLSVNGVLSRRISIVRFVKLVCTNITINSKLQKIDNNIPHTYI